MVKKNGSGKNTGGSNVELKKKKKIVEDKTFGMKNKNKSKKVQQKIRMMEGSITGQSERFLKQREAEMKQEIEQRRLAKQEEKKLLFIEKQAKLLQEKKKKKVVSAKKKVCPYFMKGRCPRGDKCTLSHDWGDTRKVEKLDLYTDLRDGTENAPNTEITCRFFIEAVENRKYGNFWTCPNNGDKCHYLHKLPQGFVFMTAEEKKEEEEVLKNAEIPLEEKIETERMELRNSDKELTMVTPESFAAWKLKKEQYKKVLLEQSVKEAGKKTSGKSTLSGRALFHYNPDLFIDDVDATEENIQVDASLFLEEDDVL